MELRWILILAGIAILFFLYLSGRPRKARNDSMQSNPAHGGAMPGSLPGAASDVQGGAYDTDAYNPAPGYADPGMERGVGGSAEYRSTQGVPSSTQHTNAPSSGSIGSAAVSNAGTPTQQYGSYPQAQQAGQNDPLLDEQYGDMPRDPRQQLDHSTLGFDIDPRDMSRPASAGPVPGGAPSSDYQGEGYDDSYYDPYATSAHPHDAGPAHHPAAEGQQANRKGNMLSSGLSAIGQKLSIGQKFKGSTKGKPGTAPAMMATQPHGMETKLVTLHVVAPEGQVVHGPRLLALFEQRGYHYGEMDVFHSLHDGKIVFSVAKMVEPGIFDINNVASFETPGITMFLQLPGPVAADVAFDVLINEASEMAEALGCSILDEGHSTLSRQTVQHLRDDVHQFMHRQRRAEAVPS